MSAHGGARVALGLLNCALFSTDSPMLEINPIRNRLEDLAARTGVLRGYL